MILIFILQKISQYFYLSLCRLFIHTIFEWVWICQNLIEKELANFFLVDHKILTKKLTKLQLQFKVNGNWLDVSLRKYFINFDKPYETIDSSISGLLIQVRVCHLVGWITGRRPGHRGLQWTSIHVASSTTVCKKVFFKFFFTEQCFNKRRS